MIETYKTEDITLHAGDRVRFTRGQRGHINNNDLATLKVITDKHAVFELDKGKTVTLTLAGKSIRHLDHGWASTAHALQGLTVPNAMAIMPSHESPLTTLSNLYVGASRHVGRLAIITDDTNRLIKTLEADSASKLQKVTYITDKPEPKAIEEPTQQIEPKTKPNEPDHPAHRTMYAIDPRFVTDPDKQTETPIKVPDKAQESQRELTQQAEPPEDRQRARESIRQSQRAIVRQRDRSRGGR